jgi:hypothetical protein
MAKAVTKRKSKIKTKDLVINQRLQPVMTYDTSEKFYWVQPKRPLPEIPNYTSLEAIRRINGVAAAIISVNASRIAAAECKLAVMEPQGNYKSLYRTTYKSQMGTNWVDVNDPEHPVNDLLCHPNPLMDLHSFIYRIAWKMQAFGYCYIYRDQRWGRTQLVDLDPNQYEVVLGPDRFSYNKPPIFVNGATAIRLFGEIGRKETHPVWGPSQTYVKDQDGGLIRNDFGAPTLFNVIWPEEYQMFRLEDPTRTFYGKGWIEYMWRDLMYATEKEVSDIARLYNKFGAEILVKFPAMTGDDVIQQTMNEFETRSRGAINQGNFIGYAADGETQVDVVKLQEYVADLPEAIIKKIFYCLRGNLADFNSGQASGGDYITARNSHADKLIDLADPIQNGLTSLMQTEFPDMEKSAKIYLENIKKEDPAVADLRYMNMFKLGAISLYEYRVAMSEPVDESMRNIFYKPPIKEGSSKNSMDKQADEADLNKGEQEGEDGSDAKDMNNE